MYLCVHVHIYIFISFQRTYSENTVEFKTDVCIYRSILFIYTNEKGNKNSCHKYKNVLIVMILSSIYHCNNA